MKRNRWGALAALSVVAALVAWWRADDAREPVLLSRSAAQAAGVVPAAAVASAGSASDALSTQAALLARRRELAAWRERLELASQTLQAYRESTRYPHEARPASEQPDQLHPNRPIVEDVPLRRADGSVVPGVHLRTTQERVFLRSDESVHLSVSLRADDGTAQPLRILRATVREIPASNTGSLYPVSNVGFNDDGVEGDVLAGDGVHGVRLQPARQGFAGLSGALRVEAVLQHAGRETPVYFDLVLTGAPPAVWTGAVREALEDGSLSFHLGAQVKEPGRYVVAARIDDARGRPLALLTFNDEVGAGPQAFRLSLFGKLVRDAQPVFPLTLRDVEAFLVKPDAFPDRALMERRVGTVHVSGRYAATAFSDAEWQSEERGRYLAELQRDVNDAQARVAELEAPR